MKTLKNNVIIYDIDCPMCNLYTGAFIKTGMLDENGRVPYSTADSRITDLIDKRRACNEIALVDTEAKTVTYGVESLCKVISYNFPVFKSLFDIKGFRYIMSKLYSFVSYNRKVIIPGSTFEAEGSCIPDLNLKYRWAYIMFCWLVSSAILNAYAGILSPLVPASSFGREFLICGGQILFQCIAVSMLKKERRIHYLGNMMTVSLAGSLLLAPAIMLASSGLVSSPSFFAIWFMLVVGLMFIEHIRRTEILEISKAASASWVAYRIMVLGLIYLL